MTARISWRFASLTVWPGIATPRAQRKRAPFKSPYERTRAHLERELAHLGARDVLLEVDCDPSQVRQDGFLRASARLRGPGVIITCRVGSPRRTGIPATGSAIGRTTCAQFHSRSSGCARSIDMASR